MKRGQVTFYIIIGIVLLGAVSFVLYIRSVTLTAQLQTQAEEAVTQFLQTNSINYYVESCLERVTLETIKELGLKGGRLVIRGDPGKDYLPVTIDGTTYNVNYGLIEHRNELCSSVVEDAPGYPRPNTYLSNLEAAYGCGDNLINGFFGYQSLPRLCYILGANSPSATDQVGLLCQTNNMGFVNEQTVQGILEEAIAQGMRSCVDFSIYEDVSHDITLQDAEIKAKVIYGYEGLTSVVTFPFKVTINSRKGIVAKKDFVYTTSVGLRPIYDYVTNLLAKDAQDINFNLEDDYASVDGYSGAYEVSVTPDACDGCTGDGLHDALLRVVDGASFIDNDPFVFQTAIKNRKPVLDYIHEQESSSVYDLKAIVGENIIFLPDGFDPDGDDVTYAYAGWKEDEDATFDPNCDLYDEDNPGTFIDYSSCVNTFPSELHEWTLSSPFISTGREAEYTADADDLGPHTVTISVTDSNGKRDYQDVKVLVFDLPVARPQGSNRFDTINNDIASTEDPYDLDGSQSDVSMISNLPISNYRWVASNANTFDIDTPAAIYHLPLDDWPVDLPDYHTVPFTQEGSTTLTLTVTSGGLNSEPAEYPITVKECFPFRKRDDEGNILTYSYPYTSFASTEYDHTCCEGSIEVDGDISGGTITTDTSTICYEHDTWGILASFTSSGLGNPELPGLVVRNAPNVPPSTAPTYNDIYHRSLDRACDGLHGNVCGGTLTDTITTAYTCNDYLNSQQDERCEGPWTPGETAYSYGCYAYGPGRLAMSFEKLMGLPDRYGNPADGICNPTKRCTSTLGGTYGESGRYLTNAVCDGASGTCSRSAEVGDTPAAYVRDCQDVNGDRCNSGKYLRYSGSCVDNPNGASCQFTTTELFDVCEQTTITGSDYCAPTDTSTPSSCNAESCCNPGNPTNPCFDPCDTVNPSCRVDRTCGASPSCNIAPTTVSCTIAASDDGYCNPSGSGSHCSLKKPNGISCSDNNECQSNFCDLSSPHPICQTAIVIPGT